MGILWSKNNHSQCFYLNTMLLCIFFIQMASNPFQGQWVFDRQSIIIQHKAFRNTSGGWEVLRVVEGKMEEDNMPWKGRHRGGTLCDCCCLFTPQENSRAFAAAPAQERENWLALLLEQGQFGQNQFWQFSELTRTIYERTDPTGQFWQMESALNVNLGSMEQFWNTNDLFS